MTLHILILLLPLLYLSLALLLPLFHRIPKSWLLTTRQLGNHKMIQSPEEQDREDESENLVNFSVNQCLHVYVHNSN